MKNSIKKILKLIKIEKKQKVKKNNKKSEIREIFIGNVPSPSKYRNTKMYYKNTENNCLITGILVPMLCTTSNITRLVKNFTK
jgi:hypothetical protein